MVDSSGFSVNVQIIFVLPHNLSLGISETDAGKPLLRIGRILAAAALSCKYEIL